jgi:hypothetical protein
VLFPWPILPRTSARYVTRPDPERNGVRIRSSPTNHLFAQYYFEHVAVALRRRLFHGRTEKANGGGNVLDAGDFSDEW